ncbi:hypothetical protein AX17_003917 [Amanita inopinata Kibby_2008]|nr:hypothetical protein AX17_003917 [Amanita inopinata Kibby_2008]
MRFATVIVTIALVLAGLNGVVAIKWNITEKLSKFRHNSVPNPSGHSDDYVISSDRLDKAEIKDWRKKSHPPQPSSHPSSPAPNQGPSSSSHKKSGSFGDKSTQLRRQRLPQAPPRPPPQAPNQRPGSFGPRLSDGDRYRAHPVIHTPEQPHPEGHSGEVFEAPHPQPIRVM